MLLNYCTLSHFVLVSTLFGGLEGFEYVSGLGNGFDGFGLRFVFMEQGRRGGGVRDVEKLGTLGFCGRRRFGRVLGGVVAFFRELLFLHWF